MVRFLGVFLATTFILTIGTSGSEALQIAGSNTNRATGYNNGKKMAIDGNGHIHVVCQSMYEEWDPYVGDPYAGTVQYLVFNGVSWGLVGEFEDLYLYPSVALAPDGTPYIIMVRSSYPWDPQPAHQEVQVWHYSGGGWCVQTIDYTKYDIWPERFYCPSITFDDEGHWHATWIWMYCGWYLGLEYRAMAVRYREQGEPAEAALDSSATGGKWKYWNPSIATIGTTPVVAYMNDYYESYPPEYIIVTAKRVGPGMWNWTTPGDGTYYEDPCLDFDPYDDVLNVAWENNSAGPPYAGTIQHNLSSDGEGWPGVLQVDLGEHEANHVTIDGADLLYEDAFGVWEEEDEGQEGATHLVYGRFFRNSRYKFWWDQQLVPRVSGIATYPHIVVEHLDPLGLTALLHLLYTVTVGTPSGYGVVYDTIYVSTVWPPHIPGGGGEVSLRDSPVPTDVAMVAVPSLFRDETTVRLEIPTASDVSARIYDISGKMVKSLFDGLLTAGTHSFKWNGNDESGAPVPSGVYLCRSVSGGETRSVKVVLTR